MKGGRQGGIRRRSGTSQMRALRALAQPDPTWSAYWGRTESATEISSDRSGPTSASPSASARRRFGPGVLRVRPSDRGLSGDEKRAVKRT